jgi:hypothetical protein
MLRISLVPTLLLVREERCEESGLAGAEMAAVDDEEERLYGGGEDGAKEGGDIDIGMGAGEGARSARTWRQSRAAWRDGGWRGV